MIEIIKECGWGVSGMVTDSVTGEPVRASVWVNNYYPVYTDPVVGDYHKFLVPGTYTLKVTANGYQTKTFTNIAVPVQGVAVTDIQLVPAPNHYAFKVTSCQIPGNNFGDEGYTPGALGQPDGIPYALGRNGWIVLDMGDTIFNGPGPDFKVIQSGSVNKAFTVSGGNNIDGPYTTIGTGSGTTSFDLGTVPLPKVRYLQIKDNGTGAASGAGAGFNLDAVEMLTIPLVANFSASTGTPCTSAGVSFTDLSSGNPTTWSWSFPGGTPFASNMQNPVNIVYSTQGIYNVSLSVSNGITTGNVTKTGFIHASTPPVVILGNDTSICAWSALLLDAGNPGMSYLWSTSATTRTIVADSAGGGYGMRDYWVRVTNPTGCEVTDSIRITFDNCTGIHGAEGLPDVTIFPNPSNGQFILDVHGFEGGSWQLWSVSGSMVKQSAISRVTCRMDVNVRSLPPGIYFLQVRREDAIVVKKIVISPNF